jgi:cell surface protein SprA
MTELFFWFQAVNIQKIHTKPYKLCNATGVVENNCNNNTLINQNEQSLSLRATDLEPGVKSSFLRRCWSVDMRQYKKLKKCFCTKKDCQQTKILLLMMS